MDADPDWIRDLSKKYQETPRERCRGKQNTEGPDLRTADKLPISYTYTEWTIPGVKPGAFSEECGHCIS